MREWGRVVLAVLVLAVVTVACGRGSASESVDAGDFSRLASATSLSSRQFLVTMRMGGVEVEVKGLVEDDYRYSATVAVDGTPVWEEVVADDHRYLRVADAGALFGGEPITDIHPAFGQIAAGGWVVDPTGSPPEFTSDAAQVPLGPRFVLSGVRLLDGMSELASLGFREYNPDAAYYLRKDDKFAHLEQQGKRFDHVPAGYDANRVVSTLDSVRPFFEYVSVWADLEGINRIERLLELPDPADDRYRELYAQLGRAGSRRLHGLIDMGPTGRTITESYVIERRTDVSVAVPEGATEVPLADAIAQLRQRLAALAVPTPLFGPVE